MDGPTLHKSYKSLQAEYTRIKEGEKRFEPYGGSDKLAQWAEYLQNNPRFAEWVKNEQGRNAMGIKEGDLDEDQQKALDAVRRIAESVVDARVRQEIKEKVAPLSEAYKQQTLERHFSKMDELYGKEWHELRDTMSEMSEHLPEKSQDNPQFEDVEDLYFKALRKSGKFDSYAAKQHEKKIQSKKAMSSDRPSTAAGSAPIKSKSIKEAFEAAKRQHG
jgi:hypothetical protein